MVKFLDKTRKVSGKVSVQKQIVTTFLILLLGFGLGVFAKFLDGVPSNKLPLFLEWLDITNFFGRFAVWEFVAVAVAVFSKSPLKAGINVFSFFIGMLFGYYLYCRIFAGFYPDASYLVMWLVYTVISPFLAFVCWYARGRGAVAIGISAVLIAIFCNMAFTLNPQDFHVTYWLEFVLWLASIGILYRNIKQTGLSFLISIPVALALEYTGLLGFLY